MTTMTIHADDDFAAALRTYASECGKSINQTIKDLLAPILGLVNREVVDDDNPFMRFCGILDGKDGKELKKSLAAQRIVDAEMWK